MDKKEITRLTSKKIFEISPIYNNYGYASDLDTIESMLKNLAISTPILKIIKDVAGRILEIEETVDDIDVDLKENIIKRHEHIEGIQRFIERLCFTLYYGFTVHEKIYDFDENGDLYLKELEFIPREYVLYENGVYKVRTIEGNIELDEKKYIVSLYGDDLQNPLGRSLFDYGLVQAFNDLESLEAQVRGLQEKYGDNITIFPYIDTEGETAEGIAKINARIEQMQDLQGGDVLAVPVPRDSMGNVNLKDNLVFVSLNDLKIDMHQYLIERLEEKINEFLMGADYSSSEKSSGSYARDRVQENEKNKIADYTAEFVTKELNKIILFDSELYNYNPDLFEFKLKVEKTLTEQYELDKLEYESDILKAESKIKISEGVNTAIESIKNLAKNMGYSSGNPKDEMVQSIAAIFKIEQDIVFDIIKNSYKEFEKKKA